MEQTFFPVTRRGAERQGIPFSSEANKNAPFPSRLKELREKKDVSQAILAKELGVSKSTVSLWETGDTLPDAKAIFDLSTYYDVSTDYLLGKTNFSTADMSTKEICEQTGLSEESVKILKDPSIIFDCDIVLLLINNLIAEWSSYQPYARFAARYWIQSEIGNRGKNIVEIYREQLASYVTHSVLYSSDEPLGAFTQIPAKTAGDFFHDRAIQKIGRIVSKTIYEYKAAQQSRIESRLTTPLDQAQKTIAEQFMREISDIVTETYKEELEGSSDENTLE